MSNKSIRDYQSLPSIVYANEPKPLQHELAQAIVISQSLLDLDAHTKEENEARVNSLAAHGHALPPVIHVTDISEYPDWNLDKVYLVQTREGWREICVPCKGNGGRIQGRPNFTVYMSLSRFVEHRRPVMRGMTLSNNKIGDDVRDTLRHYFIDEHYWAAYRDKKSTCLILSENFNTKKGFHLSAMMVTHRGKGALFSRGPTKGCCDWGAENIFLPIEAQLDGKNNLSFVLKACQAVQVSLDHNGNFITEVPVALPKQLEASVKKYFADSERRPYFPYKSRIEWSPTPAKNDAKPG